MAESLLGGYRRLVVAKIATDQYVGHSRKCELHQPAITTLVCDRKVVIATALHGMHDDAR